MEYPDLSALPAELREAVAAHGSLNVFRMIMHSPALAPGLLQLGDAILRGNSLPDPLRELAIVRVGHVYQAPYEVHHHENIGRLVGLSQAAIAAAGTGSTEGLSEEEVSVLRCTDRLLARHTLSEAERTEALEFLTVGQLSDLVITVGFYQLVSNFLNAFGVTTEGETSPY
ncbi:carboxymuconolactone decarboxylase family protein [Streptomyces turgidiscabies]|uniref:4-carboxymuconolactone decarboxylase n=1 Tax=Streptomyces turgidiscabies TaxID=85558 RepID=A0ABU0RGR6_9ACTN|nr:carboxymuconolactone decarboxylase family protein [Streptomyces turgidiscabies]MDQ0930180.1 4-carboxymuconolactone decarboxylase [Streptomyces turgidiscabies]